MFPALSGKTLYLQIYPDRFLIRDTNEGKAVEITSPAPFSHPRTLLGNFTEAEKTLKQGLNKIGKAFLPPSVLIHPMERIEGGLTQIEERAFLELVVGCGAKRVKLWTGQPLLDHEVAAKLKEK